MFDTFKQVIEKGEYSLADITQRIMTVYAKGYLTVEEMDELLELAQENANPDYQLPDVTTRVGNLETRVAALESLVDTLSATVGTSGDQSGASGDGQQSEDDKFPPYVKPTSSDMYYSKGKGITWTDGKHYQALRDRLAGGPDIYPHWWAYVDDDGNLWNDKGDRIDADGNKIKTE